MTNPTPAPIASKTETVTLVQPHINIPDTFDEVLRSSSGSLAGYSAVSSWLTCPEKSRLQAAGVRRRAYNESDSPDELSDLAFGTLAHYLRSLRILYGHDAVETALDKWRAELPYTSWLKARLLFRTYESLYPRISDTFEYLGVEVEVVTDISRKEGAAPTRLLRTVRYDTVIRVPGMNGASPELFSFEAKTMKRSGQGSILPYMPQAMSQVALWNTNPNLVQQYGPMRGVLFDCLIKTVTPNVDRLGPYYFGRVQTKLALEYLAYADNGGVTFSKQPDAESGSGGHYPRMLHACWGRWRPCDYVSLCHENSYGDYETNAGPLEGAP